MSEEQAFQEVADNLSKDSKVTQVKMFGSPGLRFNGKVFTFLWKGQLVLKLPEQRVQRLMTAKGTKLFDPGHGRVSKTWVAIGSGYENTWLDLAKEAKEFVGKTPGGKRTQQSSRKRSPSNRRR